MLFIGTQFSSLYTAVDPSLILADVVNMDYDDDDDIHAPGPMIYHLACGKAVSANRAKHRGVYICIHTGCGIVFFVVSVFHEGARCITHQVTFMNHHASYNRNLPIHLRKAMLTTHPATLTLARRLVVRGQKRYWQAAQVAIIYRVLANTCCSLAAAPSHIACLLAAASNHRLPLSSRSPHSIFNRCFFEDWMAVVIAPALTLNRQKYRGILSHCRYCATPPRRP